MLEVGSLNPLMAGLPLDLAPQPSTFGRSGRGCDALHAPGCRGSLLDLDHGHFARLGTKSQPLLAGVCGGQLGTFGS